MTLKFQKYCELLELLNDKEYSIKVLNIERGKAKPRRDIAKWSDVKYCIEYMYDDKFFASNDEYEFDKINDKEEIKAMLKEAKNSYKPQK